MKLKVYIQSNERQWLGALVSAYSMKRNSAHPEAFDVEIMHVKDYPFLAEKEGQTFLRGGTRWIPERGEPDDSRYELPRTTSPPASA